MGGRVTRQRFVIAFVAGLAGFGMLSAHAVPPPDSSLEQQADAEFARAGLAVRERLDREAAGDPLGASIAAHEAELHRYRYLDLKREINRRHPQSTAFLSVAAARDPFIPDGSFSADSGTSATRAVPRTADGRGEVIPAPYRSWDMYRPRLSMDGAGAGRTESSPAMPAAPAASSMGPAKDMYGPDGPRQASTEQRPPRPEALIPLADGPRQPFLVYREQWVGPGTRK
jgi:hypothetical protein